VIESGVEAVERRFEIGPADRHPTVNCLQNWKPKEYHAVMRRLWPKALGVLVVVVAIAAIAARWYLRQSLPSISGEVRVTGLSGPVEIVRDADAIPPIFASTKADAFYGLGYVHAQDRLWQMEFQRRIGHGRLSEIFGTATVTQDRFLRTAGFGRAARSAWQH